MFDDFFDFYCMGNEIGEPTRDSGEHLNFPPHLDGFVRDWDDLSEPNADSEKPDSEKSVDSEKPPSSLRRFVEAVKNVVGSTPEKLEVQRDEMFLRREKGLLENIKMVQREIDLYETIVGNRERVPDLNTHITEVWKKRAEEKRRIIANLEKRLDAMRSEI